MPFLSAKKALHLPTESYRLVHMCDMTHACVWHNSCRCVTCHLLLLLKRAYIVMRVCDILCVLIHMRVCDILCVLIDMRVRVIHRMYLHTSCRLICVHELDISCRHELDICRHVLYLHTSCRLICVHIVSPHIWDMTRTWHTLYAIWQALDIFYMQYDTHLTYFICKYDTHLSCVHMRRYPVATHEKSCYISYKVCQVTHSTYEICHELSHTWILSHKCMLYLIQSMSSHTLYIWDMRYVTNSHIHQYLIQSMSSHALYIFDMRYNVHLCESIDVCESSWHISYVCTYLVAIYEI